MIASSSEQVPQDLNAQVDMQHVTPRAAVLDMIRSGIELVELKELLKHLGLNFFSKSWFYCEALRCAAYAGRVDVLAYLHEQGANISESDTAGMTALLHAARGGHVDAVSYLLEKGSDIHAKDVNGNTLLIYLIKAVVSRKKLLTVEANKLQSFTIKLLQRGANP